MHRVWGADVTDLLILLLSRKHGRSMTDHFTTLRDRDIVNDFKEKHCYVANNDDLMFCRPTITPHDGFCGFAEPELKQKVSPLSYTFKLSEDGKSDQDRTILVGNERFQCCEFLFQPRLIGRSCGGIVKFLVSTLSRCQLDAQRELYLNIVLTGGTMLLPGMSERIKVELEKYHDDPFCKLKLGHMGNSKHLPGSLAFLMCAKKAQQQHLSGGTAGDAPVPAATMGLHTLPDFLLRYVLSFHCQVFTVARDKYAAVHGACAFAKQEYAKNGISDWMFMDQYDENGPTFVHKKCVY